MNVNLEKDTSQKKECFEREIVNLREKAESSLFFKLKGLID